jgi:hypothetical protein
MNSHSDNRAEDFVPGLYPLRIGAIAAINLALADMPVFGALRPQHSIEASKYENTASNRAGVESDIEAAIIDAPPPPQIEIDHSPLTDDEIAYGQRIAHEMAAYEAEMNQRVADATAAAHAQD